MNNPIESKSLTRRIRGAAHNIARRYNADQDDVEQDLILEILQAYATDSNFITQPEEQIVNYAANRAGWQARKELDHDRKYHISEPPAHDASLETSLVEFLGAKNPWPQIDLQLAVKQALSTLTPRDRQIAQAVATGYSADEIAEACGCSRRTVYNHRAAISDALTSVGLGA